MSARMRSLVGFSGASSSKERTSQYVPNAETRKAAVQTHGYARRKLTRHPSWLRSAQAPQARFLHYNIPASTRRFLPLGRSLAAIELGQKTYCVRRRRNNEPACVEIDDMDHRTAEQRQLIDDAQRFLLTASRPPRGDGRPERVHCIA